MTLPGPKTASTAATTATGSAPSTASAPPKTPGQSFSVNGTITGELAPGAPPQSLDLSLTNPHGYPISISSLVVSLQSVTLAADPLSPARCTASDFAIEQFSGSFPVSLGSDQTVTLSGLGFSTSQMPQISMVDQPYNQDGCEGARVSLSYGGTATG